ncbi:MAG: hypothetical protein FWG25_09165, partial [Promicromonosporaceae bacterium]|nr:hypothetical protein [Promicromonosporaceae bacterium]
KYGPTGGTKPLGTREEERLVEAIDEMKVQGLDHPRRNPDGSNTYHVSFQRPDGREFHTEFTSGPLSDPRNVKPTDVLGYNAEFAETWDGYLSQEKDYDYAGFDAEEMGEVELAIKYATHENRLKGNAERLREFLGDSLYESAKEYSVDGGMLSTRLIP